MSEWLLYSCIPPTEQRINYSDCCTAAYHQLNNVSTTVIAVQLYTTAAYHQLNNVSTTVIAVQLYTTNWISYQLQWLLYSCIPPIEQRINYSDCCTAVYHQLNIVSTTVIAVQLYTTNWTSYQLQWLLYSCIPSIEQRINYSVKFHFDEVIVIFVLY